MTVWFPNKPELSMVDHALLAVFAAYNEQDRLPYFLEYYRSHGVTNFLAIDNGSTDGTAELLRSQPDVTCFTTLASYAASNAGRLWTTELARHYAAGRWCLTLDIDEILVFPGSESTTIRKLTEYLDEHGYESLFTVFLDMYARGKLSEAVYVPGRPFLELCDRYEVDSYTLHAPITFPHLQVSGGPRQRLFREQGNEGMGPSMRKLPLMKWTEATDYVFSTHSCRPCRLADITGATLHFKFFASFKNLAQSEVARGDRRQMDHYRHYATAVENDDPDFEGAETKTWSGTAGLVRDGVMVLSAKWANFLRATGGKRAGTRLAGELRDAQRQAESAAMLRLRQLPVLWPMFNRDLVFRLCEVRGNRIIAILREATTESAPRLMAMDMDGEKLAEAQPFDRGNIVGLSEGQQRSLVQIVLPESPSPRPREVQLVLEPSLDVLAVLTIERKTVVPRESLIGACMPGEGTVVRFKFEGDRFELNECELSLFVDGIWRALVPVRTAAERREIGNGRERRYLHMDLHDLLSGEGSLVEAFFARRNIRLRKSPLVYREGMLTPVDSSRIESNAALRRGMPKRVQR